MHNHMIIHNARERLTVHLSMVDVKLSKARKLQERGLKTGRTVSFWEREHRLTRELLEAIRKGEGSE